VDALGNLAQFVFLPGQSHDLVGVKPLIHDVEFGMFRRDKAFDADSLRTDLSKRGAVAVIPPKLNQKEKINCDFHAYRWRHLVENFFFSLKTFQRIAAVIRSSVSALIIGGRPRRLAAASPAITRSRVSARSYCARAPNSENSNSPCGVVVSICSVSDRNAIPRAFRSVTIASKCGSDRPSRSSFHTISGCVASF